MCSNVEHRDTVFASVQLQDESSADDVSEGIVIEEDSNEVVIYDEEDSDEVSGMQFITEQIVTEQLSTKSNTIDCKSSCPSQQWKQRRPGLDLFRCRGLVEFGPIAVLHLDLRFTGRGSESWLGTIAYWPWASYLHLCTSVTKQYNLVAAKEWSRFASGKVAIDLAPT